MNSKPVHRQRQITKKSTRLTVEFLEKRVVLDADPIGDILIDGSPLEGQEVATPDTLADADSLGTITTAISYSPVYTTINERNFGYYVPESYDPSTPTPLLFMFHGMGGDSSEQSGGSAENGYYGWQTTAHENGFIVLFPESLGFLKTWDLGAGGSSSDLAFVDDMIDWASTNYNISTSQIFTTGHSWGAYFSYYVARYRSDDIAAFGAHSGGLGGAFFLGSTPPVPTGPSPTPTLNGIVLHAVDDGIVPYSNSQNLYDDLVANGHNVYDDGIGNDGIIEVDGWGPDNHRYRRQHNQTQWDFFLSVSSTPETPNQPPALNKPLDLILNENASPQSIALTGITSGNGDVQPVRVTAVSDNPGLIPDPTVTYSSPDATGTLAFTPVANQHGTATITVTVEDPGTDGDFNTTEDNLTVRQTFNVTVTQVNDAPTLNDIAASTNEDVPVDISLNATDIDSTTLTYAVTNDPIGGSVSVVDGVATYAPFADFFGTDSFVITVNDNHPTDPRTDAATVTVNVASVNDAPTLNALSDINIRESDPEQIINLNGMTAGGGETQVLSVTAVSDNPGLIPDPTVTYSSPDATGTLAFTPVANQHGTATITVTVEDPGTDGDFNTTEDNLTVRQTFNVTVTQVNDAPTLNDIAASTNEDVPVDISLNATDIDSTTLTYAVTNDPIGGSVSVVDGVATYAPFADFFGTDSFVVTVNDNHPTDPRTDAATVTVNVASVNDAPTLNALSDISIRESDPEQIINLNGMTAGGGETQVLSVTAVSDNPGLIPDPTVTYSSPDATGTLAFTPVANQHGTATITVTVEDPGTDGDFNTTEDNLTVRQTFNVTVTQVNDAPTLNDIAASTNEDVPVDISLNATDIDSTTLTYAVTNDPIGGSVSVVDGVATYAPFADFFGTDSFVVTVNDNHPTDPRTDAATVTVNVASVNDAPTLTPLSNLVLAEDSPTQLIRLADITAGGGEEQPLFVDVQSSNTTLISNASVSFLPELGADMRLLGFSPNPSQYGAATLTVTVTDGGFDNDLTTQGDNATCSQSFDVTVTPNADAPPASPAPLQRMFIHESRSGDTVATYHIPAMNINGEPVNGLATRLTATSSDANLIPHPVTVYASTDVAGALSFTPVVGAAGTATLTVQVEDGGPDNSFANADDNRQATHAIEVTVLDILSEDGTAILSQDGSGNIYADTQPIVHRDEQSKIDINGFSALAAESDDGGNALIVRREMTDYRLIADETWKVSSLFHSLGNTNVQELDISARGSAYISEVAISNEGAFMVAGVEAPTITVRRNETYTFDLNTPNHPFYLQTAGGGYQESLVYAAGFNGNGHTSGRYSWTVPDDAPDELFYQSGVDENVFGRIVVSDVPGDD